MAKNMSFLPEDYLEKRVARRTNIICLSLFVVVMMGVGAAWLMGVSRDREVQARLAEVNRQFEDAARKLEQLEELQGQKQQMIRKAKVASVLVERVPRTLMLSELVNHMPATLSLLEMNLTTEQARVAPPPRSSLQAARQKSEKAAEPEPAAPQTVMKLRMVGLAPTDVEVAQYITDLNAHPMFRDVNLQYSEQTKVEEREMRKFALLLTVNQDVDLRTLEPTRVARDLKMDPMADQMQIGATGVSVVPTAAQE